MYEFIIIKASRGTSYRKKRIGTPKKIGLQTDEIAEAK